MQQPRRQSQLQRGGFTLVELLIVIVVIAILAAISVVAYRGVANNAQSAALKANLVQAAQKLELYRVDNGGYPPDQATVAGLLKFDASTTLGYAANNSADPQTYCLTATQGTQQFSLNSISRTPSDSACVTNLATDPRAITIFSASGVWGGFVPSWFGTGTNAGTTTLVSGAVDGPEISPGVRIGSYLRKTWTVVQNGSSGPQEVAYSHHTAGGVPATAGSITVSSFIRFSKGWTVDNNFGKVLYTANALDASHTTIGSYSGPLLNPP